MSPRLRLVPVLVAAVSVVVSGLALAAPAHAASQTALLGIAAPIHENVRFGAAGSVTPIKVGRPVDLQIRSGSRWSTVDTVKQDQYGGLSFSATVRRTSKAKDSVGYEWRYFRLRARASGSLKEKVTPSKKVKVMLDPKVYYRVVRASVQHTENASVDRNGCGVITTFSATRRTSSALGRSESGRPKWRAKRLGNGSIQAEIDPGLATTWTQEISGCRYAPAPAACTTTRVERPSGDGKERLGIRITAPKKGSRGSVLFFTRPLNVGFPSADDSVCNMPWLRSADVPTKIRTTSVPRSRLLGTKPFTIVNQGNTAWTKDSISGRPADLKLRFTESITLQRVDSAGRPLK